AMEGRLPVEREDRVEILVGHLERGVVGVVEVHDVDQGDPAGRSRGIEQLPVLALELAEPVFGPMGRPGERGRSTDHGNQRSRGEQAPGGRMDSDRNSHGIAPGMGSGTLVLTPICAGTTRDRPNRISSLDPPSVTPPAWRGYGNTVR